MVVVFVFCLCLVFVGFSLVVMSRGRSPVGMPGLLVAMASLVPEHRLQACGLQSLQHMGSVVRAAEI